MCGLTCFRLHDRVCTYTYMLPAMPTGRYMWIHMYPRRTNPERGDVGLTGCFCEA
jgi:hypothetical protein